MIDNMDKKNRIIRKPLEPLEPPKNPSKLRNRTPIATPREFLPILASSDSNLKEIRLMLQEILARLNIIENRLKNLEEKLSK
jgi:hypothetical protein